MPLPTTQNHTYANHESVSASDLVDLQEQLRAFWRGRRRLGIAVYPAYSARGEGQVNGAAWGTAVLPYVAGGGSNDTFFALDLEFGARIRQIFVSLRRGGANAVPWALERVEYSGDTPSIATLASGTLSTTVGAVVFQSLFTASPLLPRYPVRRVSGVDTQTHFRLREGANTPDDRCYGIEVWYDFPVGAPKGDSLTP
jgi:hypothetical protein